ncbi:hypothetical protein [Sporosarcina ureae]|nr:hypothetical protein [Sporosarcina ureae]
MVDEIIQEKELISIGGGPGGYTAAIRAAQLVVYASKNLSRVTGK